MCIASMIIEGREPVEYVYSKPITQAGDADGWTTHYPLASKQDKCEKVAVLKLVNNDYTPYVVARGYNPTTGYWRQGHYYTNPEQAWVRYKEIGE